MITRSSLEFASHSRRSLPPVARIDPSGLKATAELKGTLRVPFKTPPMGKLAAVEEGEIVRQELWKDSRLPHARPVLKGTLSKPSIVSLARKRPNLLVFSRFHRMTDPSLPPEASEVLSGLKATVCTVEA